MYVCGTTRERGAVVDTTVKCGIIVSESMVDGGTIAALLHNQVI